MLRAMFAMTLTLLCAVQSANAQPATGTSPTQPGSSGSGSRGPGPARSEDLQKMQAEIDRLKSQVESLEAAIKKMQAAQAEPPKQEPAKKGFGGGKGKGGAQADPLKKIQDLLKGKGGVQPDQLKKLMEKLGGAGAGGIDADSLKKLIEQIGGSIDPQQIQQLMELKKLFDTPGDAKPSDKKPDDKPQPKPAPGATSAEGEPRQVVLWQSRLTEGGLPARRPETAG